MVNVGITHDTVEFAVESIRRWLKLMGRQEYPGAKKLLKYSSTAKTRVRPETSAPLPTPKDIINLILRSEYSAFAIPDANTSEPATTRLKL